MKKFNGKSLAIIVLSLFTIHYSLFTNFAFAQTPQKPAPQPCKNPVQNSNKNAPNYQDYSLTDNFITAPDGDAPIKRTFTVKGNNNEVKTISAETFPFEVNFSKLQAIFASDTSNYLEGNFQDENHQQDNLTTMDSTNLNNYYGANQKLIPKYLTDLQKKKYVDYVSTHPGLTESANKITDIYGNNPKTIYDLVSDPKFGSPKPAGEEQDPNTWGKYWAKIPTAYSEFYQGNIELWFTFGEQDYQEMKAGNRCATPFYRHINFVLPEFFRTASVSDQLNQVLVPKQVQTDPKHTILQQTKTAQNLINSAITFCKQILRIPSVFQKKIGEIVRVSFNFINPVKVAFAQSPSQKAICISALNDAKAGNAPYCPLPLEEANQGDVSCADSNDPNKLEKDNHNVTCTFTISWPAHNPRAELILADDSKYKYTIKSSDPDCQKDSGSDTYTCTPTLRVWPNFRIPWVAQVWNNTTYGGGPDKKNPGVFGISTPKSVVGKDNLFTLDQPGESNNAQPQNDIKINNIGGEACNLHFSRDIALKPRALQDALGITQNCGN